MKVLVTDYDGTLCYGGNVMPSDIEAIEKWQNEGNMYVIATGRSKFSIFKQLEKFNLHPDYLICNNGGMIYDGKGNPLEKSFLDALTAIDLIYAAQFMNEDVASVVINDGETRHRLLVNPNVTDVRYPTTKADITEEDVEKLKNFGQVILSMANNSAAIEMAEQINEFFGMNVTAYPNNTCVDVVPKDISKSTGLDFLSTYLNVDEDDVYTIGDSYNDIPLMEYTPNGYAIEMSPEDVKSHAKKTFFSVKDMVDEIETY